MKLTGLEIAKLIAQEPAASRIVEMVWMGNGYGIATVPEEERRHLWVKYEHKDGCLDQFRMDFIEIKTE